jgi:hypothetical protein
VLAVFDKIDLSTLAHEGISYEGIGYLMLIANTVVPGLSLASGLFLMGEDVANIDEEDWLFRVATAALGARTIVALASSFLCASLELFVLVFFSRVATAS